MISRHVYRQLTQKKTHCSFSYKLGSPWAISLLSSRKLKKIVFVNKLVLFFIFYICWSKFVFIIKKQILFWIENMFLSEHSKCKWGKGKGGWTLDGGGQNTF